MSSEDYLSTKQISQLTGHNTRTVRWWRKQHGLPHEMENTPRGSRARYKLNDVLQWAAENGVQIDTGFLPNRL
jgi:hypothetical protein